MKKYLVLALALGALVSCRNRNAVKETATEVVVVDIHNSQNSLDYWGSYKGVLPCADCEGIETVVTLDEKGNFTRTMKYLGKGDGKVYEEKGKYVWVDNGSTIEFESLSGRSRYLVGENTLTHLDQDGNRITGDLADLYILKKE